MIFHTPRFDLTITTMYALTLHGSTLSVDHGPRRMRARRQGNQEQPKEHF